MKYGLATGDRIAGGPRRKVCDGESDHWRVNTIKEVENHFATGADTVTLSKSEWDDIMEICRTYFATGTQLRKAEREIERVRRIAKPLWWACKIASKQMRNCACSATRYQVMDWEIRLRLATRVDWHDLPPERRGPPPKYR